MKADRRIAKIKLLPMGAYFAKRVPTTWLDPLLTGEKAVIGKPPYNCKDIERLLQHIADRIRRTPNRAGKP